MCLEADTGGDQVHAAQGHLEPEKLEEVGRAVLEPLEASPPTSTSRLKPSSLGENDRLLSQVGGQLSELSSPSLEAPPAEKGGS